MNIVLPIVVFVSGAVVMILELAASRIIAPYLGTSIIVWTSLIGVILAALSGGNWIGGRIADKWPAPRVLALLLAIAAALVALSAHFQSILSSISSQMDLQTGAIAAVMILFGPATIALGTIAPFAVKLSLIDIAKTGRTVGNLYALSNTGSIIGTFLGGFILISLIGSTKIVLYLSLVLIVLAALILIVSKERPSIAMIIAVIVAGIAAAIPGGSIILSSEKRLVADIDTRYSRTWVYDQTIEGLTLRVLANSVTGQQSAHLVERPELLIFPYIRMYEVYQAFAPDAHHALMIGGSAYTYPRHWIKKSDAHHMTVAEIDPGVTTIARTYFDLEDDPQLSIVHEDGRTYLNRVEEQYDVIFVDAFSSHHTIPFHLTTREAIERIDSNLTPEGLVLVNIISTMDGPGSEFLAAEYATYKEVFSHVKIYQVDPRMKGTDVQNVMLIASDSPLEPLAGTPFSQELASKEWTSPLPELPPLTDDFAPVERYTVRIQD